MRYSINEFKVEHRNISEALNKLEKNLINVNNPEEFTKHVESFFKQNVSYVAGHIEKEEMLYQFLKEKLDSDSNLKEITISKKVISDQVLALQNIHSKMKINEVQKTLKIFLKEIRERIDIEESTIFQVALMHCPDGIFDA